MEIDAKVKTCQQQAKEGSSDGDQVPENRGNYRAVPLIDSKATVDDFSNWFFLFECKWSMVLLALMSLMEPAIGRDVHA